MCPSTAWQLFTLSLTSFLSISQVSEDDKVQLLEGYEIISDLVAHWPKFAGDQEEVKGDSVRRQVLRNCHSPGPQAAPQVRA